MISLDKGENCGIEGWNEHFKKFVQRPFGRIHRRRIFVAEFDYELLALRGHDLERAGYEVITCHDTKNIMGLLQWMIAGKSDRSPIDLIICDVNLLNHAVLPPVDQARTTESRTARTDGTDSSQQTDEGEATSEKRSALHRLPVTGQSAVRWGKWGIE